LAEGQELRASGTPGWLIVVYIVAVLIGLPILASLIGTLVSAFMR
jgi:Sec-independent protein translocase protein TatA